MAKGTGQGDISFFEEKPCFYYEVVSNASPSLPSPKGISQVLQILKEGGHETECAASLQRLSNSKIPDGLKETVFSILSKFLCKADIPGEQRRLAVSILRELTNYSIHHRSIRIKTSWLKNLVTWIFKNFDDANVPLSIQLMYEEIWHNLGGFSSLRLEKEWSFRHLWQNVHFKGGFLTFSEEIPDYPKPARSEKFKPWKEWRDELDAEAKIQILNPGSSLPGLLCSLDRLKCYSIQPLPDACTVDRVNLQHKYFHIPHAVLLKEWKHSCRPDPAEHSLSHPLRRQQAAWRTFRDLSESLSVIVGPLLCVSLKMLATLGENSLELARSNASLLNSSVSLAESTLLLYKRFRACDVEMGDYVKLLVEQSSPFVVHALRITANSDFLSAPEDPDSALTAEEGTRVSPTASDWEIDDQMSLRVRLVLALLRLARLAAQDCPYLIKCLLVDKRMGSILLDLTESFPSLRYYALRLLKLMTPFLGKQWRAESARLISQVYLSLPTKLEDDWLGFVGPSTEQEKVMTVAEWHDDMLSAYRAKVGGRAAKIREVLKRWAALDERAVRFLTVLFEEEPNPRFPFRYSERWKAEGDAPPSQSWSSIFQHFRQESFML